MKTGNKPTRNSLIIKHIAIVILLLTSHSTFAQFFDSSQNPTSVKWRQINTLHFQVIYPSTFEREAQRMASTLDQIIGRVSASLHKQPRNISIILQNQTTIANGFVQLAPRRSEFYTTPPQENDPQDWLNSLAVHELRHVVQFDKLTGYLGKPLFEELALAIYGVTLPAWFFEGDAVGIETALTNAGRGRLPSWDMPYRASLLSDRKMSYSKAYLGSLNDITPGYYQLGYLLTSDMRKNHGKELFEKLFDRMRNNPLRPYNFSNSLKKFTGLNTAEYYKKANSDLKKFWQEEASNKPIVDYAPLNKKHPYESNYLLPNRLDNDLILCLKNSSAETPRFITIDKKGNEKLVFKIGRQDEPHFSLANGLIVWDELRYDPRFNKRSYSVICSYHIGSGSYHQVSSQSRLFSPALSADASRIIAVNINYDNSENLVEIDPQNGHITKTYPNLQSLHLQKPAFNAEGTAIAVVAVSVKGKSLLLYNCSTGEYQTLIENTDQQLARPQFAGDLLIFKAHYNDTDNLYAIDPKDKHIDQISQARYGAFNPSYNASTKNILFNNYDADGYNIAEIPLAGKPLEKKERSNFGQAIIAQENTGNVFDSISTKNWSSKPYRELSHLFYFHSLEPIFTGSLNDNDYKAGLQLLSNNKLNTSSFYMGSTYSNALKRWEYKAGMSYKGFYPVIDLNYTNSPRLATGVIRSNSGTSYYPISWREHVAELSLSVPFNFSQLNKSYSAGLSLSSNYIQRYDVTNKPSSFINTIRFPIKYRAYFSTFSNAAPRDITSRWGQSFSVSYNHLPFANGLQGELFVAKSSFYFPGLFRHHSFTASFNYQNANGAFRYNEDIPTVYGYNNINSNETLSNTLLLNYRFPIAYPDWELGPLAYIKRIKAGLFCHYQNIGDGHNLADPKTFGMELRADMNLLRYQLPVFDIGARYIFVNKISNQNPILEFIFTYNY